MSKSVKNDFQYIRSVLLPFMKENSDKRISNSTFEHYKLFATQRSNIDEIVINEVSDDNTIFAISVATIRNGSHVTNSTTVTHKSARQKGYGTTALQGKLDSLKQRGMGIKATIAEDNIPGMKLCAKVGLKQVETRQKTRATGPFNAVIWIDPPLPPKEDDDEE